MATDSPHPQQANKEPLGDRSVLVPMEADLFLTGRGQKLGCRCKSQQQANSDGENLGRHHLGKLSSVLQFVTCLVGFTEFINDCRMRIQLW